MQKVVFDTNVFISALITSGGRAEKAYLLSVEGSIVLHTSIPILTEMAGKLRTKFLWEDDKIIAAVKHISMVVNVAESRFKLNILKDDPDNKVLECAKDYKADLIVTADKHLLALKKFEGIHILRITEFLERIT